MADPEKISSLLDACLARHATGDEICLAKLCSNWADVVGKRVAEISQPIKLRNRLLTVSVSNHAWFNELSLLKPELLKKIREVSAQEILDVQFVFSTAAIRDSSSR